jgi:hypothetical protein
MELRLLKTTFTLLLCTVGFAALAATGPSDAVSAPPATAAAVGQVLCAGSTISLKGPTDPGSSYKKYQWYKLDANGNKTLVKDGTGTDNAYTEASDGAGYYNYQLVIVNTNDCSSDISDPYKVYVLPPLVPTIAAAGNVTSICEKGASTTTLTASVANTNYAYTYQWQREGTDIPGATANSYLISEANAATVNYGVKVSYSLNGTCAQTATQVITVVPMPVKPAIVAGP